MVPIIGLKTNGSAWEPTKQMSEKASLVVLKLKRCLECREENAQSNEKTTEWVTRNPVGKTWATATITRLGNAAAKGEDAVAAIEGDAVLDVPSAALYFFAQITRAKEQPTHHQIRAYKK